MNPFGTLLVRRVSYGGVSSYLKYYIGDGYEAEWKLDKSSPYYMPDDNSLVFNHALTPNKTVGIAPQVSFIKGHNLTVAVAPPQVAASAPDWNKDFEISWNFQVSLGTLIFKEFAGMITCEVCMWLDDLTGGSYASQFNFKKDWQIRLTSKDADMLTSSVRYLTPRAADQPLNAFRFLILQSFKASLAKLPALVFRLQVAGTAINTTSTDGGLVDGTRVGADLSITAETEAATISVEGFEPE